MSGSISSLSPTLSVDGAYTNAALGKERAQLNAMARSYQSALNLGYSSTSMHQQAKQITDAANALGVAITLPTASASSPAINSPGPAVAAVQNDPNKVDLKV